LILNMLSPTHMNEEAPTPPIELISSKKRLFEFGEIVRTHDFNFCIEVVSQSYSEVDGTYSKAETSTGIWVPDDARVGCRTKIERGDIIEIFGAVDSGGSRVFGRVREIFYLHGNVVGFFVCITRLVVEYTVLDRVVKVPKLVMRKEQSVQIFPLSYRRYSVKVPEDVVDTGKNVYLSEYVEK